MTAVEWLFAQMSNVSAGFVTELNELEMLQQAKEMERERTSKLCYGVWRAVKTGANYIYISKDSSILGFVEPLSEEDRLKIDVELFIAIKSE
jgi:hypothetical protein